METAPRPIRMLSRAETKLKQKFTFWLYIFRVEHKNLRVLLGWRGSKILQFQVHTVERKILFFQQRNAKIRKNFKQIQVIIREVSMGITVRYANLEDLPRVNELRKMVNDIHVENRPDIFRSGFCEEMKERLYQVFEAPESDVIVACIDGFVCGFAVVEYVDMPQSPYKCANRFYQIHEFGVDEAFRRRGVATALVDYCREEAKRLNFDRMELDAWEFNEAAIKFYESAGFLTYRRYMEQKI